VAGGAEMHDPDLEVPRAGRDAAGGAHHAVALGAAGGEAVIGEFDLLILVEAGEEPGLVGCVVGALGSQARGRQDQYAAWLDAHVGWREHEVVRAGAGAGAARAGAARLARLLLGLPRRGAGPDGVLVPLVPPLLLLGLVLVAAARVRPGSARCVADPVALAIARSWCDGSRGAGGRGRGEIG